MRKLRTDDHSCAMPNSVLIYGIVSGFAISNISIDVNGETTSIKVHT